MEARVRRWRWAVFSSTWFAYAGLYFCRKAFYAVKKPLGDELGFDEVDLAVLGTAYLVAYTIGQFVSAGLGQRLGARVLLLTGLLTSVGANIVFGLSNNLWTFLAFMVVNGLAQSTGWCACMGTLGAWTGRRERGTLMSFWATCYQLGGILATSWAGYWLASQGWRGSFLAASVVTSGAWVGVFFFQRNTPEQCGLAAIDSDVESDSKQGSGVRPDAEPAPSGAAAARGKQASGWTRPVVITTLLIGCSYFGIKFVRYAIWSWSAYFLGDVYGLDGEAAAYYSTLFDAGGFAGVIFAGVISDRYFGGRRATLSLLMLVGMTLGCGALYVLGTASLGWFIFGLVLVGFMLYGPDSLLSGAAAIEVGSRRTALAAAGIINGMGSVGSVIQELLIARVYQSGEGNMGAVFALLFAASLVAFGALVFVVWRNRRGVSDL